MNPFATYSIDEALSVFIALVIVFSAIIALLYCVWGGLLLIMSGGKEEKIKPAVNHIRHAVIGLVAILFVIFFAPKVLSYFGLPFADDIEASHVFSTVGGLADHIFGSKGSSINGISSPSPTNDSVVNDPGFSNL